MSEPLVVVGNGMAAARLVDELAKVALGRYAIAVIGDEPRLAYNRVLLSSVLAGETASHEIELKPAKWWRDRGVTSNMAAAPPRSMSAAANSRSPVKRASRFPGWCWRPARRRCGSTCPAPILPASTPFATAATSICCWRWPRAKKRVVVVGGGLLGLEAAYGLAKAGAPVTLIHLMDRLMERQLDAPAAALLKSLVERKGIKSCSTPIPRASRRDAGSKASNWPTDA